MPPLWIFITKELFSFIHVSCQNLGLSLPDGRGGGVYCMVVPAPNEQTKHQIYSRHSQFHACVDMHAQNAIILFPYTPLETCYPTNHDVWILKEVDIEVSPRDGKRSIEWRSQTQWLAPICDKMHALQLYVFVRLHTNALYPKRLHAMQRGSGNSMDRQEWTFKLVSKIRGEVFH